MKQSYEQARVELEKAVQLNPKLALAYSDLGDLLAAQGRAAEALAAYRRAIAQDAKLAEAHYGLATVLVNSGEEKEAEQELRLAIRANADDYQAHLMLGRILEKEGNATEARLHYLKAAESADPGVRQAAEGALASQR
jgi:tetratricopeptide (TPR) repeat protein